MSRGVRLVATGLLACLALAACSGTDAAVEDDPPASVLNGSEQPDDAEPDDADDADEASDVPPRPSPGCDQPRANPVWEEQRYLDVDGTQRWYLVTAPAAVDPMPLVLDFHGLAEGATFHTVTTSYSDLAEANGFVVAFPHGTGAPVRWSVDTSGTSADARFVDELLGELGATFCIDEARVYATGMSNGALLSSVLGCTRSETFAAIAPVAGVSFPDGCEPEAPMPVMAFHGTADPILGFNGGVGEALGAALSGGPAPSTTLPEADLDGPGHPDAMRRWAEANDCTSPVDVQFSPSIVERTWDCPAGVEMVFYMILGGGHTWPGSDSLTNPGIAGVVGATTFEVAASEASWDFFTRHSRG